MTLIAGLFAPFTAGAQELTAADADSAYNAGEFARAIDSYNYVIGHSGSSPEILFNLGNAYTKGGDYGRAMLSYQRALRLNPSDKKLKDNISYIRYKVTEANKSELRGKKFSLEPESRSFFGNIRYFIERRVSSDAWAGIAAGAFILFIGAVALYIFVENVLLRKIGFFGGFCALGICLVMLIFAFMGSGYKSSEGVITAAKVKLHTEASDESKEGQINLTKGTVMTVLDIFPEGVDNPQWYKVRLNSDFIGWIKAEDFEPVEK